jgi:hypothetical protein
MFTAIRAAKRGTERTARDRRHRVEAVSALVPVRRVQPVRLFILARAFCGGDRANRSFAAVAPEGSGSGKSGTDCELLATGRHRNRGEFAFGAPDSRYRTRQAHVGIPTLDGLSPKFRSFPQIALATTARQNWLFACVSRSRNEIRGGFL